jgi:hypothetical protein
MYVQQELASLQKRVGSRLIELYNDKIVGAYAF